jgi:hypothetical protein
MFAQGRERKLKWIPPNVTMTGGERYTRQRLLKLMGFKGLVLDIDLEFMKQTAS